MALATKIAVRVEGVQTSTLDKGTQRLLHAVEEALNWPTGTAASQADEVWSDSRSVNAAAHDNLDLTSLTQLDSSGGTVRSGISFAVIKLIFIRNTSTSGYIEVGGGTDGAAAADAWALSTGLFKTDASLIHVPFGGGLLWYDPAGVAVTNASADVLHVGGVSATQTYDILIIGEKT